MCRHRTGAYCERERGDRDERARSYGPHRLSTLPGTRAARRPLHSPGWGGLPMRSTPIAASRTLIGTALSSARRTIAGDCEVGVTESDLVAGSKPTAIDPLAVHHRSVRRLQIDDRPASAPLDKHSVASRDTGCVKPDVTRTGSPQQPRGMHALTGQPATVTGNLNPVNGAPHQRNEDVAHRRKVGRQIPQLADRAGAQRRLDSHLVGVGRELVTREAHRELLNDRFAQPT